jgi:hypothetical protein
LGGEFHPEGKPGLFKWKINYNTDPIETVFEGVEFFDLTYPLTKKEFIEQEGSDLYADMADIVF